MSLLNPSKKNLEKEKSLNQQSLYIRSMFSTINMIWMKQNAKIKNLNSMGEDFVLEFKIFLRLKKRHPMRFLIKLCLWWRKLNVTSMKLWLIELTELASVMLKKNPKKLSKNIVTFSAFRHRIKFYRTKSKLKNDVKIKLDLAKSRYDIFTKAIETAKQSNVVD